MPARKPILVAGGGIGGLAAALALTRRGHPVRILEQASQIGEIGAGVQLGPNAFWAFDALGVGERTHAKAVYTERLVMMDALDASEVAAIPAGEAFRERFGNPYAVCHRADVHQALLEGAQASDDIELLTSTHVERVEQDENGVRVIDTKGRVHEGAALVACDGVKSAVRQQMVDDAVRVSGHVVYRAVADARDFPEDLKINAPCLWAGPNCHLVHYPMRGGEQYNVVVTFHSRKDETWGVTDGSPDEVFSYLEDAVTLAEAIEATGGDFTDAFARYERSRIARTARVVFLSREMGRIYHARGVERLVRNDLWRGRTPERFYDALEWLYGWRVERCLAS